MWSLDHRLRGLSVPLVGFVAVIEEMGFAAGTVLGGGVGDDFLRLRENVVDAPKDSGILKWSGWNRLQPGLIGPARQVQLLDPPL